MKPVQLSKLILITESFFSDAVLEGLKQCGICHFYSARGRQMFLKESSRFFGLFPFIDLTEERSEVFRFYVPQKYENKVIAFLGNYLEQQRIGIDSLFAENAEMAFDKICFFDEKKLAALQDSDLQKPFEYKLLCCIVPLGKAETISKRILEMGLCVPFILLGEGVGLRKKLGLVRITIPVDKEVMWFLVPDTDAPFLFNRIIKLAELERAMQGILILSSVRTYTVNKRLYQDRFRNLATMDQIISALDEVRGSTQWRQRKSDHLQSETIRANKDKYVNISFFGNDGTSSDAVMKAMELGAGGATLIRLNNHICCSTNKIRSYLSREMCDSFIPHSILGKIMDSMDAISFYSPPFDGYIEITDVEDVFAYSARGISETNKGSSRR